MACYNRTVSKVDELTKQLDDIRRNNQRMNTIGMTGPNSIGGKSGGRTVTPTELEKLRQELAVNETKLSFLFNLL